LFFNDTVSTAEIISPLMKRKENMFMNGKDLEGDYYQLTPR
jgi:hypothetical protein